MVSKFTTRNSTRLYRGYRLSFSLCLQIPVFNLHVRKVFESFIYQRCWLPSSFQNSADTNVSNWNSVSTNTTFPNSTYSW